MIPAQLPLGAFAPLAPLFLIVGAFTLWLWGRHGAGTSGKPVAVMAVTFSSVVALAVFAWQQSVGAPQALAGPRLMVVTDQVLGVIDLSFYVDGLSLFWLALVSGLGALTFALDSGAAGRGEYLWWLLALACAQLAVLTDNLVVLFAFWELGRIAVWRLMTQQHTGSAAEAVRPPLAALAADLPLLLAVAVCWNSFGSFHLSLLTDPRTLAAFGPNQRAALVWLAPCVVGAAYARCLQFPFCSPVLHAGETSTDSARVLVTLVVPPGLYLLLRFQTLIAAEPFSQTLLVGGGALSALLWGGMAVTQPTLMGSVTSYFAGTIGLVFAGIGCGGAVFAAPLLLAGSVTAGCWAMLQLADIGRHQQHARLASRATAVIAVAVCCGVFGQEAVLNRAWSALIAPEEAAEPAAVETGVLESTDSPSEQAPVSPVVPAVVMLAQLLLSLALFRGLFRRPLPGRDQIHDESPPDSAPGSHSIHAHAAATRSSVAIVVVLIVGLAVAPLLSASFLWRGSGTPFSTPGVMGLLMMLGLLLAWVLSASPSGWPARMQSATGGLATANWRSVFDESIQLIWVFPWTLLGWLAAAGDRTFLAGLERRLHDVQAGLRQSAQASLSEGPLAVYVITLIMGAALMIVLLVRG